MNIIDKLFRSEANVTAAAKQETTAAERLQELQTRFSEVTRLIAQGEATEEHYMEEKDLRVRLQAASDAHAAANSRAMREGYEQRTADFLKRRDETMSEIGLLVPRLQIALVRLKKLIAEAHDTPWPAPAPEMDSLFGVPTDFADRVLTVLIQAGANVEWDFSATGPKFMRADVADPPKLRPDPIYRIHDPAFNRPPPGFSGVWDYLRGKPSDGEPVPVTFLLPAGG